MSYRGTATMYSFKDFARKNRGKKKGNFGNIVSLLFWSESDPLSVEHKSRALKLCHCYLKKCLAFAQRFASLEVWYGLQACVKM